MASAPVKPKPPRKESEAVDIGGLAGQFLRAYLATNEEIEDVRSGRPGLASFATPLTFCFSARCVRL
jgi:hypothetical protein